VTVRNTRFVVSVFSTLFIFGLLYPFKFGYHDVVIKRFEDALHLPIFLLLAVFFRFSLTEILKWNSVLAAVVATAAAASTAYLVESIQPLTGRSGSWIDLRNGILGILVFTIWEILLTKRPKAIAYILTGITFLATFYITLKPAIAAYDLRRSQREMFPVLVDFSRTEILMLWGPSDTEKIKAELLLERTRNADTETSWLRIRTTPGHFSGAEFDAYGFDWSGYSTLNLELDNRESEPLELNIRLDDCGDSTAFKDRYNGTLSLPPGRSQQSVPLSEIAKSRSGKFNLAEIKRLLLFVDPTNEAKIFALRRLWLSR
jgi:hypothetical protein